MEVGDEKSCRFKLPMRASLEVWNIIYYVFTYHRSRLFLANLTVEISRIKLSKDYHNFSMSLFQKTIKFLKTYYGAWRTLHLRVIYIFLKLLIALNLILIIFFDSFLWLISLKIRLSYTLIHILWNIIKHQFVRNCWWIW